VTFSGATQLYAGDYGNYQIVISKATGVQNRVGIDVAASDTGTPLTVTGGEATTVSNAEVTHSSGLNPPTNLNHLVSNTTSYHFRYTMPATATAGSPHNLYGVAALGATGTAAATTTNGWNFASTATVTTKALPTAPATASAGTPTSSSVPVSWSAGGPLYRVTYKTSTFSTNPNDGSFVDVSGSTTTIGGLSASTAYYFSVYSRDTGVDSGANFFSATAAQVTATTGVALEPNPWVDAAAGNDSTNAGTSDAPFKTIKKALTAVGVNGTIHVRPGTYNTALGETFPITVPSGLKLQSTAGPASTIIDATGANSRVLYFNGNSSSTLVEGFTITGGFYQPPADGSNATGGAIFIENSDQTAIKRCIFSGNEARGYNGTGSSFVSGGIAYGGAIGINNGTNLIVNCVFRNNIARGGNGFTYNAGAGNGGSGGDGHGGGIWEGGGAATLVNNTFYGNQAIGGNGGSAIVSGSGGNGGLALYGAADVNPATANNNIFANNSVTGGTGGSGTGFPNGTNGGAISGGLNATAGSNNLFFSNTGGDGFTGTSAITGSDPLFVGAPGDLHLRSASPAKFAGTSSGAPTVDVENSPRPSIPTIGAYEIGLFLTVTGGIGRITVTWPGVAGASSYNLYFSQTSPVTTSSTKVTGATSPYVLSPLPNNSLYYFAVAAVENNVEGPLSPQVSGTSSNGPGGPWVKAITSGSNFTSVTRDLANGTTLYATATDAVGLYKSTNDGDSWSPVTGPFNGSGMHAAAANGSTLLVAGQGAIYRSINGGGVWTTSVTGAGIGEDFINSLGIDPLATSLVYGGDFHIDGGSTSTQLVAKSANGGATFNNLTDATASNLRAYFLQIDPTVSGTLYVAGSGTPNVTKSVNNGSTWTSVSPAAGYPTSLAIAPNLSSTLYAGMRDVSNSNSIGVYKTTNSGSMWTAMNTGLPMTLPNVNALLVDPTNANRVHAGTSQGYYVTTDGGTNWSAGASGAGNGINSFALTSTRRLIATAGAFIFMLPLDPTPTISGNANPASGSVSGGDVVTISGTGFNIASGLRVLFGGVDGVVNPGASSSTSISVTTPAHASGAVDVAVINPDGQAAVRSNGFTFTCAAAVITPISANYSSSAATGSIQVTLPTGCSWTATAPGGSFVSITSGSPGNGSGTVQYSVGANGAAAARSAGLTIAGQPFLVTQSGSSTSPITLNAVAANGQVALSWSAVSGASYEVRRSDHGGTYNVVTTTSMTSFVDTTVSNGTGYLYIIDALNGGIVGWSNVDLAVPFAYTRASLTGGFSIVIAADFMELRTALNAARTALGRTALAFTDPSLVGVVVKRVHLVELRSGVDDVRAAVSLSPVSYTDPSITAGVTSIRAIHILDLRSGLQ
jgi:hypothetical protein